MLDAVEMLFQRLDAAFLGLTAGDPVDVVVADQRLFHRVGVGGLGIVDPGDSVAGGDQLLAMGQTGIGGQTGDDGLGGNPLGAGGGVNGAGVLPVVLARQMGEVLQVADRLAVIQQHALGGGDAVRQLGLDRNRHHPHAQA